MFAFENLKNNRPIVVSAFGLSAGNYLRSFWNLILLELRKGVLFGTPGLLSLTSLLCFVYLPHKYKRNRIFPSSFYSTKQYTKHRFLVCRGLCYAKFKPPSR